MTCMHSLLPLATVESITLQFNTYCTHDLLHMHYTFIRMLVLIPVKTARCEYMSECSLHTSQISLLDLNVPKPECRLWILVALEYELRKRSDFSGRDTDQNSSTHSNTEFRCKHVRISGKSCSCMTFMREVNKSCENGPVVGYGAWSKRQQKCDFLICSAALPETGQQGQ